MNDRAASVDGYRPDIDGLRAVAVLAVLAFHAFPARFPGGFIGVDIFFVISGFLISGIIFKSLDRDTFSFTDFYKRRIKRIFPALITVLAACLVFGWFALLPSEYEQLTKHTIAGAGFISNVKLWRESGYFDTDSVHKPLLHLWSLGIEEQFYLVWPAFLFLLWKQKKNVLWGIAGLGTVSLIVNILTVNRYPSAAFYLPFSRFWELLSGAALAYLTFRNGGIRGLLSTRARLGGLSIEAAENCCAILGLLTLAIAFLLVGRAHSFPGWWAVLPILGAVLIITAGPDAWVNRFILRNRAMVLIGLISYPLYLWHWPLLSFARIVSVPTARMTLALVSISFALAYGTWRFIELGIRSRRTADGRITLTLIASMLLVCVASGVLAVKAGVPSRVPAGSKDLADTDGPEFIYKPGPTALNGLGLNAQSRLGHIDAAIVGDSHAWALYRGLALVDKQRTWLLTGNISCPPTLGITVISDQPECAKKIKRAFEWLVGPHGPQLVVVAFMGSYAEQTDFAADHLKNGRGPSHIELNGETSEAAKERVFSAGLLRAIGLLVSSGKRVYVVFDVPELPFLPSNCVARPMFNKQSVCSVERSVVNHRQEGLRRIISCIEKQFPSVYVFDPAPLFCTNALCTPVRKDFSYYFDSHHLSIRGSKVVATALLKFISDTNSARSARQPAVMHSPIPL